MTLDKNKAFTFTIDKDDGAVDRAFRATRELMERIVEAENVALMNEINANAVVINGRKYGMLNHHTGLAPTIFGMRVETRVDMPDDWDFFLQERPPLVLTNYDRIVHMTPEELAEWIMRKPSIGCFAVCPPGTKDGWDCPTDPCEQCWLDWLKSPVEVDDAE